MQRVLVVSDEPHNRQLVLGILQRLGYETVEADGYNAVLKMVENDPKRGACYAVITDMDLGSNLYNGASVFRLIRDNGRATHYLLMSALPHSDPSIQRILGVWPEVKFIAKHVTEAKIAEALPQVPLLTH